MTLKKYLIAALVPLVLFGSVVAIEPPVALLADPPVAVTSEPPAAVSDEVYDAKAACVSVWNTGPGADGKTYGGSGVVIASESDRSIVVTNNHIFSSAGDPQGGFRADVYPLPAKVIAGTKTYKATALFADRDADIAVVEVEGKLTAAKIGSAPKVGDKVWRNGNGTGYQTGRVLEPAGYGLARFTFYTSAISESGDSGSGYFNEKDELVAIHCGKDGGTARGTVVTSVTTVVKTKTPFRLFPRLRDRLDARRTANDVPMMVVPQGPPAALVPQNDPPKVTVLTTPPVQQDCPGGVCRLPGTSYQTYPGYNVGTTTSVWGASGCAGGSCPTGPRLFSRRR